MGDCLLSTVFLGCLTLAYNAAAPLNSMETRRGEYVKNVQSINRMARAAFGPESGLSEEVETALMELADQWVTSALTLGSGAARKRKSSTLMPEDVAKCIEPIW